LLPVVCRHEPIISHIRLKYNKNNEPNKQIIRLIFSFGQSILLQKTV
jgi:hypothetical protein